MDIPRRLEGHIHLLIKLRFDLSHQLYSVKKNNIERDCVIG